MRTTVTQAATLNDVVGKLDDIHTRIVQIEERQQQAAKREEDIDKRLKAVEQAEKTIPWKLLGAAASIGALLLIPSVSTLIMLGRRDAQLESLSERVQRIDHTTASISEDVAGLTESRAAEEARREDDRRRLDALERATVAGTSSPR
jgi:hypothetical protein